MKSQTNGHLLTIRSVLKVFAYNFHQPSVLFQKVTFQAAKGHLLGCKSYPFTMQKVMF